jgi:cytochrome c oxidase subunit II
MNLPIFADIHKTFWFPEAASSFADRIDTFYYAILWICIIFFVPIVVAMIYFTIKYRQRPGYKGSPEALHNNTIEVTWTVVPTLIVVWIFWEGAAGYLEMSRIPDDAMEVNVYAQKWNWSFKYKENGAESPKLYLPVNRNVKLIMQSKDVLHSFFVPAFRAKRDVVPGRYSYMWFKPTVEGEYDLFCTEYCGDNHSTMITKAIVLSEEKYAAMLAELNKEPDDIIERGRWLYQRKACMSCHYAGKEGAKGPGPSYNGSWGKPVQLSSGEEIPFNEQFVKDSVRNPAAQKRKGYENAAAMPAYPKNQLKDEQLEAIIAFIESLKDQPK